MHAVVGVRLGRVDQRHLKSLEDLFLFLRNRQREWPLPQCQQIDRSDCLARLRGGAI